MLTNQNNNNSGRQVDVPPPTLISSVPAYYQTNSTVGPLCNTLWGQLFPFNYDCPANNDPTEGDHMPVGCVEVAMGQVMHFWQHPSNYNWSIMPLTLAAYLSLPSFTNPEAQLLSDIGTTSGPVFIQAQTGFSTTQFADYTDGNTKSDDTFCPFVFGVFGYSSASRTETISDQVLTGAKNGTAYAGLLTNEIQTYQRPCMVGGASGENDILGVYWPSSDNHEWVCDGSNVTTYYSGTTNTYKSFYGVITTQTTYTSSQSVSLLHMNWGWVAPGGETDLYGNYLTNNGWYDCSVNYSQADAKSLNFGYFQTVIYQIHP